jgi:GDP-L-fucose synthase
MNKNSKILIVGHNDIIENSLQSFFRKGGYTDVQSSALIGLDPTIQASVYAYFQKNRPGYVFLGSTRSGGIEANRMRGAEFLYHNSEGQNNIFYAALKFETHKLLYFASSCVYPRECAQPMGEDQLLTGPLEKTSEPYAVAKIAGIKLCEAFRAQYHFDAVVAVPATVYGPGNDIEAGSGHVMGVLIKKFADAVKEDKREVVVWGTGRPRREFLYVDDFVEASRFLMEQYDGGEMVNIGPGSDVTIKELAEMIAGITGFKGNITFDPSKPDGTMQKLLSNARITRLGWKAKVPLQEGIQRTLNWYLREQ